MSEKFIHLFHETFVCGSVLKILMCIQIQYLEKKVVVGSRKDIKQKYIMEFKFIQIEYFEISRKIFRSSSHFRGCYVLMLPGWEVASFFFAGGRV